MKQYKVNEQAKNRLEEFAGRLEILAAVLRRIIEGRYGAKTEARDARKELTEIKKQITEVKRETLKLFEGR